MPAGGRELRQKTLGMTPDLFLPLITGLLGGAHCLGMCGGFVLLYSSRHSGRNQSLLHLSYNSGRILAYSLIGALMGAMGSFAETAAHLKGFQGITLLLASILMILAGLGMLGIWREAIPDWLNLTNYAPFRNMVEKTLSPGFAGATFPMGFMLGFLPCGLVYTLAIRAAASGSALEGGLIMASFGLGTLPAMFGFGVLSRFLTSRHRGIIYSLAAVLVILMGIQGLLRWAAISGRIEHGLFW